MAAAQKVNLGWKRGGLLPVAREEERGHRHRPRDDWRPMQLRSELALVSLNALDALANDNNSVV
jgi:hypothetical protein